MRFKKIQSAIDLRIGIKAGDEVRFDYGGKFNIQGGLRKPDGNDTSGRKEHSWIVCEAICEREPNANVRRMLERYLQEQITEGSEYVLKPLHEFAQPLQSFCGDVSQMLSDYSAKTVHALRWRLGGRGPHNVLRFRGFDFSLDGNSWFAMPRQGTLVVEGFDVGIINDDVCSDVKSFVENNLSEPLGHVLWQEAWFQRSDSSRSAVVLGIAAAESAIKEFISSKVPNAQWLIENLPSPPIVKMYKDYLPKFLNESQVDELNDLLNDGVVETVRKGVNIRNQIVHLGRASLKYDTVEESLIAVRDLLWFLDYCNGNEWAKAYIGKLRERVGRAW